VKERYLVYVVMTGWLMGIMMLWTRDSLSIGLTQKRSVERQRCRCATRCFKGFYARSIATLLAPRCHLNITFLRKSYLQNALSEGCDTLVKQPRIYRR
jgi:hypothetical protein